jgi:hypothetical protein
MKPTPPKSAKPTRPVRTENTPAPAPAPEPARAKSEADRLTIPLDKDGLPDFGSMRDKTRERVKKIVSDPAVARELGLDDAKSSPAVSTIPPFLTRAVVNALSQLDTIVIARITGAPAPIVLAVAPYTQEEKDAIAPALESILNKYGGKVLNKWGDEVALLTLLSAITLQKVEAVRAAMAAHRPAAPVLVHPSAPAPAPAAPAESPAEPPAASPEMFQ